MLKRGWKFSLIKIVFCHVLCFNWNCLEMEWKELKKAGRRNESLKVFWIANVLFCIWCASKWKTIVIPSLVFSYFVIPARHGWIWMRFYISKRMPSFTYESNFVSFSMQKRHFEIYIYEKQISALFLGKQALRRADEGCIESRRRLNFH